MSKNPRVFYSVFRVQYLESTKRELPKIRIEIQSSEVAKQLPMDLRIEDSKSYAPLAQLVEQLTLNQWVPGSNP